MRARRTIEGAAFGPGVLKAVSRAFERAWGEVAEKFLPHEHEAAREILAHSMMSMTRDDTSDVEMLKQAGVRAMHLAYPSRFASGGGQSGTDG